MRTALILTTGDTSPAGPVLSVAGDLDYDSAQRFRTAVQRLPLQSGQILTLDLAALTFCDSSGITALIAARNHTLTLDADLTLTTVPPKTARIIRMLGLERIFHIMPPPRPAHRDRP